MKKIIIKVPTNERDLMKLERRFNKFLENHSPEEVESKVEAVANTFDRMQGSLDTWADSALVPSPEETQEIENLTARIAELRKEKMICNGKLAALAIAGTALAAVPLAAAIRKYRKEKMEEKEIEIE